MASKTNKPPVIYLDHNDLDRAPSASESSPAPADESAIILQERARLGREIHDGLAQTLSYLTLQAERLETLIAAERVDTAATEIAAMRQTLRAATLDVRQTIDGLRWQIDATDQSIQPFVDYAQTFAQQTGITLEFSAAPSDFVIALEIKIQLFRIMQEALANIRKHAQAQNVRVMLRQLPYAIEFQICDDGRGFPNTPAQSTRQHHGLATMRERAEGMSGIFAIASSSGQGTHITITVPIQPSFKSVV